MASMPGKGRITRQEIHFFWIVDSSGSMEGLNIQSLNTAMRGAIPSMRDFADQHPNFRVLIRALQFGSEARWLVNEAVEPKDFLWRGIKPQGETAMGEALTRVAEKLSELEANRQARYLPPVLVLVTDGYPTDEFEEGRARLMETTLGREAMRVGIGIGLEVDVNIISKFIANPKVPPMQANNAADIASMIQLASTTGLSMSSTLGEAEFHSPTARR
jgi:uncharacterized protein YegL